MSIYNNSDLYEPQASNNECTTVCVRGINFIVRLVTYFQKV